MLALLHLDPALLDSQLAFCGIAAATLAAPGLLLWAAHSSVITGKLSASRLARFWSLLTSGSRDDSGSSGSDSDGGGSSGRARSPRTPFVKLAYRCAERALPSLGVVPRPASLPALPPTTFAAARPSSTAAKCRLRPVPTSLNGPQSHSNLLAHPAPPAVHTCSYVPLVWGATLAVYSELLLREAGSVLQVRCACSALCTARRCSAPLLCCCCSLCSVLHCAVLCPAGAGRRVLLMIHCRCRCAVAPGALPATWHSSRNPAFPPPLDTPWGGHQPTLRNLFVPSQVGAASLGMAPNVAPGVEAHPAVVAFIQGSLVLGGLAGSVLLLAQYTNTFQRPRRKRSSHSLHLAEHAAIMVSPLGLLGVLGGAALPRHGRARRAGMAGNAPSRATGTCARTSAWWAWWVPQLHRDLACLAPSSRCRHSAFPWTQAAAAACLWAVVMN